jgi:hypothetical protein
MVARGTGRVVYDVACHYVRDGCGSLPGDSSMLRQRDVRRAVHPARDCTDAEGCGTSPQCTLEIPGVHE